MTRFPGTLANRTVWLAILLLAGCGWGVAVRHPVESDRLTQRSATIVPGETTRDEVEELLGKPWLRSQFWRFDVYRAHDVARDIGGPVILFVPVPVGVFKRTVDGYLLLTYDETQRVAEVSSGNASKELGNQNGLMLRSGDVYLGVEKTGKRGPHIMVNARRLPEYVARRQSVGGCTVVLSCEETAYEKWPYETCPDRVAIDSAAPVDLQPFFGACDRADSCPAGASGEGYYVRVPLAFPIPVSPGQHRLTLGSSVFKGRQETVFDCPAGSVRYGAIRGAVQWHWWGPKSSTLNTSVAFEDTPPSRWGESSVLIFQGERWIAEAEPDPR